MLPLILSSSQRQCHYSSEADHVVDTTSIHDPHPCSPAMPHHGLARCVRPAPFLAQFMDRDSGALGHTGIPSPGRPSGSVCGLMREVRPPSHVVHPLTMMCPAVCRGADAAGNAAILQDIQKYRGKQGEFGLEEQELAGRDRLLVGAHAAWPRPRAFSRPNARQIHQVSACIPQGAQAQLAQIQRLAAAGSYDSARLQLREGPMRRVRADLRAVSPHLPQLLALLSSFPSLPDCAALAMRHATHMPLSWPRRLLERISIHP